MTSHGINPADCTLLPSNREATTELLNAIGLVDLVISLGCSSLIRFVREQAHGSMALPERTTYKYIIEGNGQTKT